MSLFPLDDAYAKAVELCNAAKKRQELTGESVALVYLGQEYTVNLDTYEFTPPNINMGEQILLLHFLSSGKHPAEEERFVSYESLPGGMFYFPTFKKRGPERLVPLFGPNPELLLKAGKILGAERTEYGDTSIRIQLLPEIAVIVVVHAGDDEFDPEIQFLFRRDITAFLPLEDIAVLGGVIDGRMLQSVQITNH